LLSRSRAARVFDAAGALVTPGLIDVHGHVYDSGIPTSIDPDMVGIARGVTTIVDAGSTGAFTFPGFRKHVVSRAKTRLYAWLNFSAIGLVVGNELYIDAKLLDPAAVVRTVREHPTVVLGIKVRITGRDEDVPHDIDALKKAREAADEVKLPIMLHWTNDPRLLGLLRTGDVLVHPFNPPRAGPSCLGPDGRVLPQILEARARGVLIDFAHGTHLLWETAEQSAKQGFFPDTISTDVHRAHVGPNGVVGDLVTTMTKFVTLGLTVEQAIEKVTVAPTRMLRFPEPLGTLVPGSVADVSILAVEAGEFTLLDSARQPRATRSRITARAAVRAGELVLAT
jgi:dihydroorotase